MIWDVDNLKNNTVLYHGAPSSAAVWKAERYRNSPCVRTVWTGSMPVGSFRTQAMSRQRGTLFSLIGEMTVQSTMWESWRNARMARSTPWRAILAMPASSGAIQSGAAQSTVTVCLLIRVKAKEIPEVLFLWLFCFT